MAVGIGLRELVQELEEGGFTLGVTHDSRSIEVTKPEELGDKLLAKVSVIIPSHIELDTNIKDLEQDTTRKLLPPIFNYTLSYLASTELELSELTSGRKRPQIIKDIVTEDSVTIRQGMINQLIQSDKLMMLADVYGDTVCRRIDLLSAIRELGYQDSTVTGRDLNIRFENKHVATLNLDDSHSVRRELDWGTFPTERREELKTLLKWYVDTPRKFRNINFSLIEQVLISNLPRQYKWAYRDENNTLWAVTDFKDGENAKKEIVCDVDLFKMITPSNPFPTHLSRVT